MRENFGGFSEEAVNSLGCRLNDWFEAEGVTSLLIGTVEVGCIDVMHNRHPAVSVKDWNDSGNYVWYKVYYTADGSDEKCSLRTGLINCRFGLDGDTQNVVDFIVLD